MATFLKKHYEPILFTLVLIFAVSFSLSSLITKPKLWYDEGLSVELAKNFFLYGKLDAMQAPGVFSGNPYLIGGSGYPLTVPLAGFFYFFGLGPEQARVYMILWIIAVIFTVFFVARKFFGSSSALFSVLLVSTFAPFYGTGRTVLGDIPGFFFLLWGVYFLMNKKNRETAAFQNHILAGLFFGIALSSKPSVYMLLLPALFFYFLIFERENFWRKAGQLTIGVIPPLFLWLFFILPDLFSKASWLSAIGLYLNPYAEYQNSSSPILNIYNNLSNVIFDSTLFYLFGMFFIVFLAFFRGKSRNFYAKESFYFAQFLIIYGVLVLIYFLKSPGWFRYLLPLQIIIFILFFPALIIIFQRFFYKVIRLSSFFLSFRFAVIFSSFLVCIQLYHLFFSSALSYSSAPKIVINFIKNHPDSEFGFINVPQISSFASVKSFQYMKFASGHEVGDHPLEYPEEKLHEYVIFFKKEPGFDSLVTPYENILEQYYESVDNISGYHVFKKI